MNDFEQTKVYATKAYRANPSNPHVLSIYGESLLRNGDIETAIRIFEKMYELEPLVAADTNSDRPLQSIFSAYYMSGNFDKCKEIFDKLDDFNSKTWISLIDMHKKNDEEFKSTDWFQRGMSKFKDLDWKEEIKTFHLNSKEDIENFLALSSALN
jgi:tetratricopeptide (TPR) repeat protein